MQGKTWVRNWRNFSPKLVGNVVPDFDSRFRGQKPLNWIDLSQTPPLRFVADFVVQQIHTESIQ